jgi:endonuclease YncB( thermonuclease family)
MKKISLFILLAIIVLTVLYLKIQPPSSQENRLQIDNIDSVSSKPINIKSESTKKVEINLPKQANVDSSNVLKPIESEISEIDSTVAIDTLSKSEIDRSTPPNNVLGKVMRAIDGDTVEIFVNGYLYKVRYLLIDTPETHDPFRSEEAFGQEAYEFNRDLIEGKVVRLEKDITESDKYGRLLRYVYLDSIMINLELLRNGLAEILFIKPDVKHYSLFSEIQKDAQKLKLGIWSLRETPQDTFQVAAQKNETEFKNKMKNLPKSENQQIIISHIFYDGIVPRSESDEFIEISNIGQEDISLQGWKINAGTSKQNFTFSNKYILKAGECCRVYTNEIHPESGGFSFQNKRAIWKNSGDTGYLINNKNKLISSWEY